jgi:copper chaperone NosL
VLALAEITDAMVLTPVETGADDQKEGDEDYLDRLRTLPQKDGD